MAFYKAVLNGSAEGQDVKNILWYRTSILDIAGDILMNGEQKLAEEVYNKVWNTPLGWTEGGQDMKAQMPASYTLDSIDVYGYDDDFGLVTSDPYHQAVSEVGAVSGTIFGPANCVILHANTKPVLGPGTGLPKRGYLAVGPVTEASVGDNGIVNSSVVEDWNDFGVRLGTTLLSGLLGDWTFIPCRVRVVAEAGVVSLITFKDVDRFVCNNIISYRRSRKPTA